MLALALAVTLATAGTVEVRIEPRNSAELPEGTLVLRGDSDAAAPREIPMDTRSVSIEGPSGTRAEAELRAAGWWAPRTAIAFSEGTQIATMPAWRTGRVQGRVTVAGAAPPQELRLIVESPPDPRQRPEIERGTEFRCPVNRDGTWQCDIPATTLDIAVRAPGFTPHYRWGSTAAVRQTTDFGTMLLRKGGSVVAWLDGDSMRALRSPARAALVRLVTPGEASIATARLAAPVAEATFNARGAVQLTAVPPGIYALAVTAEGFAVARAHPIEVSESSETILRRAITLEPPLTLRVRVTPAADQYGAPWNVSLRRRSDFSSGFEPTPATTARTDESGLATLEDQSPGDFAMFVRDSKGNAFLFEEWTLAGGTPPERHVEVPLVAVQGKVRKGSDAVAATLSFGGTHGAVRVEMRSDERGEFRGHLPRAGKWRVAIRRAGERAPALLDVDVPDDGTLTIELPDTSVSGIVLDSRGELVARARVTMLIPGTAVTARTDFSGRFAFESVPFGRRTLSATAPDGTEASQPVEIDVTPEMPAQHAVELKLLPKRSIAGRIVSAGAPVAGARVRALPLGTRGGGGSGTSDTTGAFRIAIREDVGRVSIVVAAPGHALQAVAVDAGASPLTLDLIRDGGTLLLDLPRTYAALDVTLNGVWIPSNDLFGWAAALGERASDGPRRIPNVAPGAVRVCVTAQGENSARCRSGQLARGESLRLDLAR